nr:hypothetical protein [Geminicoccus harenae]
MLYLDTSLLVAAFASEPMTARVQNWLADQHLLGLRAGDAMHLAVASAHGATVHTVDHRLAEAAPAVGAPTRLLARPWVLHSCPARIVEELRVDRTYPCHRNDSGLVRLRILERLGLGSSW